MDIKKSPGSFQTPPNLTDCQTACAEFSPEAARMELEGSLATLGARFGISQAVCVDGKAGMIAALTTRSVAKARNEGGRNG